MMRLPRFSYLGPRSLAEAAAMLADAGPEGAVVAGGTDLWPNMKRRQQTPKVVIGLRAVPELRRRHVNGDALLGAGLTLSELLSNRELAARYPGLMQAVGVISTPQLRNMGTLGGNLCLDTRCNYYDQSYEWRKAIDFCMKKDGAVCWVAPGSPRCWAVSSSDSAPLLVALGARAHLHSARDGARELSLEALYSDDGIAYLSKRPDEILTAVALPDPAGDGALRSSYQKLRRRGAFDFPVVSVAAAARVHGRGPEAVVTEARIVLGAVGSHPIVAAQAAEGLRGRALSDEAIAAAAEQAAKLAKPLDNTDYALGFRKRMAARLTIAALRDLRG
jgi:4-hydroxybenzoyl-CoA reductase subunit beta